MFEFPTNRPFCAIFNSLTLFLGPGCFAEKLKDNHEIIQELLSEFCSYLV